MSEALLHAKPVCFSQERGARVSTKPGEKSGMLLPCCSVLNSLLHSVS